jgi:hypothetical protein
MCSRKDRYGILADAQRSSGAVLVILVEVLSERNFIPLGIEGLAKEFRKFYGPRIDGKLE